MALDVAKTEEVKVVLRQVQEKQKNRKATEKLIALLNQDSLDVKEILESIKFGANSNAKIKTTRPHYI
jgi:hypothetical protein